MSLVQVNFGAGAYVVYECEGATIGDWIVLPPTRTRPNDTPRLKQVHDLGKGNYEGSIRQAHLVPRHICNGEDQHG